MDRYVRKTISFPEEMEAEISRLMGPGEEFAGKSYSEVVRALVRRQVSAPSLEPLKIKGVTVNRIHAVDSAKLPVYAAIWFAGTLFAAFLGGVLGTILAGVWA